MITFLKRLFCKHNYGRYYVDIYSSRTMPYMGSRWFYIPRVVKICKHCGKEFFQFTDGKKRHQNQAVYYKPEDAWAKSNYCKRLLNTEIDLTKLSR